MTRRVHRLPQGADIHAAGGVRFRLWAPIHAQVRLALEDLGQVIAMRSLGDGWHEVVSGEARSGTLYRFVLPEGLRVPDPASRFQPQDVHGPSEVIDPAAHRWTDDGWQGRPWHEAVIYELHLGTFTGDGTFLAAIERLDHLVALGITALQICRLRIFLVNETGDMTGCSPTRPTVRTVGLRTCRIDPAAHSRGLMVLR